MNIYNVADSDGGLKFVIKAEKVRMSATAPVYEFLIGEEICAFIPAGKAVYLREEAAKCKQL